jgi:tetratricopeptide (TPR) repeat protein
MGSVEFSTLVELSGRLRDLREPTTKDLRALALLNLVAPFGEMDQSVRLLERLRWQRGDGGVANVLSDLSAAYLARAQARGDLSDALRALDSAEAALDHRGAPRVVAQQVRHAEHALGLTLCGRSWSARTAEAPVNENQGLLRWRALDRLEIEIPLEWSEQRTSGRTREAGAVLEEGRRLLRDLGGAAREVAVRTFDDPAELDVLVKFARARRLYVQREISRSRAEFSPLVADLPREHPVSLWSRYYMAASTHWQVDQTGYDDLSALRGEAAALGSRRLLAHVDWMIGLRQTEAASLAAAASSYRSAIARFDEAGLTGQAAIVRGLLADVERRAGRYAGALKALGEALAGLDQVASPGHASTILETAQEIALALGLPHAALHLQNHALDLLPAGEAPLARAERLADRAALLQGLGKLAAAVEDLEAAALLLRPTGDEAAQRVVASRLLLAASRTLPENELNVAQLDRAIEVFRGTTGVAFAAPLLALRGRIAARAGDATTATRNWVDALQVLDRLHEGGSFERADLGVEAYKAEVVDTAVAGFLSFGETRLALWAADRLRAWDARPDGRGLTPLDAALPPLPVPGFVFHALPDRLIVWSLRRGAEPSVRNYPITRAELTRRAVGPPSELARALTDRLQLDESDREVMVFLDPRFDSVATGRLAATASATGRHVGFRKGLPLAVRWPAGSGGARARDQQGLLVVGSPETAGAAPPLPGATAEALSFSDAGTVLVGSGARREAILSALDHAEVFVYFGHFGRWAGDEGMLVASGEQEVRPAVITRFDLRSLHNVPAVVVLAACGDFDAHRPTEGLLALAREFTRLGSRRVLFSREALIDARSIARGDLRELLGSLATDVRFDDVRRFDSLGEEAHAAATN